MNPEKQRIAIAKASGWRFFDFRVLNQNYCGLKQPDGYHVADVYPENKSELIKYLPDYLNDLNAIYEAEKNSYIFESWRETENWLNNLEIATIGRRAESRPDLSFVFRATAAQRAKAFLLTLNLWED